MESIEIVRELGTFKHTFRKNAGVGWLKIDRHEPVFAIYQRNLITGYISFIVLNTAESRVLTELLKEGENENV